ncbi:MAG: hypothetical protein KTR31_02990 [Myxococcales bacterium]|nr:hypothetical protein [Myxococcales bacterium]
MTQLHKGKVVVIAMALIGLGTACESRLTGNEGNFQFSYDADDRLADFNKPIAVGAFLDIEVADVGRRQPVTLDDASFDDGSVLSVLAFADDRITVEGMGEGQALLSVSGSTVDGQALTDSVNLLARVPEVMELRHTCTDADAANYELSTRVWVPFDMTMSNGQPVIGYGYTPVTPSTSTLVVSTTDSTQQFMAVDTSATAGPVSLDSDIDDASLAMTLVAPSEFDGVVEPVAWVLEDIDVGDTNAFYALPSVAGVPVCQASSPKTVTSDTPEICTVRDRDVPTTAAGNDQWESGWFDVTGVAEGTCQFTVTYPQGNGGAGASAQFEYPIEP